MVAVDAEASRGTVRPAVKVVEGGGENAAVGGAPTLMLMVAEDVLPTLSVTVSFTTTMPGALVTKVAVGSIVTPEKLAELLPLSTVHE